MWLHCDLSGSRIVKISGFNRVANKLNKLNQKIRARK